MPQTGVQDNGPSTGNSNRRRRTLRNNASKEGGLGFIPPLGPQATFGYSSQLAQLRGDYLTKLAELTQTAKGFRSQFRLDRSNIIAARRAGLGDAANSALERGMLGSSVDVEGRSGVKADAAAALASAKAARDAGIQAAKQNKLLASNLFHSGVLATLADKRAAQAQAAAQSFQSDEFDTGAMDRSGQVDVSQLQLDLPNWYSPQLVTTGGGVTLSAPAAGALRQLNKQLGVVITGGGYRSVAAQQALDRNGDGIKDGSNGVAVAPPGQSWHNAGLAIDIAAGLRSRPDWPRIVRALRAAGWRDNVPGEPWHFSYRVGSPAGAGNPGIR